MAVVILVVTRKCGGRDENGQKGRRNDAGRAAAIVAAVSVVCRGCRPLPLLTAMSWCVSTCGVDLYSQ